METGIWDYEFLSKREIHNELRRVGGQYGKCMAVDKESAVHRCMDALLTLPSADVVRVVRCRECKHWKPGDFMTGDSVNKMLRGGRCPIRRFSVYENDFCSEGESR